MARSKETPDRQGSPQDEPLMRVGENARTWFRSSRVFKQNEHYYVSTREGIDVGPFDSEEQARRNAARLIEILERIEDPIKALIVIREFNDRPRR